MKKLYWTLTAVALVTLTACSLKVASSSRRAGLDPLILRAHFIGTEQLLAAPGAARLKEVWNLKSSAGLREEILTRSALLPSYWLGDSLPKGASSQTNLFRPLLEDVLAGESYIDCTAAPEFLLAVKVSDARARVWDTNLRQALAGWKISPPAAVKSDSVAGFEVKHTGLPGMFRCLRAGEWIVVSAGSGKFPREAEVLANIKSMGRPAKATGAWLEGDANLARFDGWLPALANFENLPVAHFSLSNRADFVRTHATLDFARPHGWKPEPWQIPSNQIHDPLVSFLAVRGVAPIFEAFKPIRELGYKPTPNQVIGWGYNSLPFQFNYAAPSRNVREQLQSLTGKFAHLVLGPQRTNVTGEIAWDTNAQQIVWRGLPLAVPHLGVLQDSGREFLVAGCLPPPPGTNRAPPGLYQALSGRDDLVAFDYEMTAGRLPHWRQFHQLTDIASRRAFTATEMPAQKWLMEFQRWLESQPQLGEAVGELRVTSPTQMAFARKSVTGLTAFEAVALGRWLESTNFPAFGTSPLPPSQRLPAVRPPPAGK
jgi:hypothetical protein